jgi:hypothetical protein
VAVHAFGGIALVRAGSNGGSALSLLKLLR